MCAFITINPFEVTVILLEVAMETVFICIHCKE